jgi:signal transduction histidine kinase
MSVVAVLTVVAAYCCPGVTQPPLLSVQLSNWISSVVLLHIFVAKLVVLLEEGARELSVSAEATVSAKVAAEILAFRLSGDVRQAVKQLEQALIVSPEQARIAAKGVQRVLEESREQVPSEPVLKEPALGEKLQHLRLNAWDWCLLICVVHFTMQVIRNAFLEQRISLYVSIYILGVALVVSTFRILRPVWRYRLAWVFWMLICPAALPGIWTYIAYAPVFPPNLITWFIGAVFAGACLRPMVSYIILGLSLGTCLLALHFHPGVAWTAPVSLSIGYGVLAWTLWNWPERLLKLIQDRRDAAVLKIRERRRLVATLFHDLANPLMVVLVGLTEIAEDIAEPGELGRVRSMVERMRATLERALSGTIVTKELEAGEIYDSLEALFRERFARKRLRFLMQGPRDARFLADEALLRDSVLANLISNAIKFSPSDSSIHFSVRKENKRVVLIVDDQGPGLPADVIQALSQDRISPSRAGSIGEEGSGYGLMLARHYLMAMGGNLALEPRAGGGLSAQVRLPAA